MNYTICILGRQYKLGLAELESLYGSDKVQLLAEGITRVSSTPEAIDFNRLGGSLGLSQPLLELPRLRWQELEAKLIEFLSDYLPTISSQKIIIGTSIYNLPVKLNQLQHFNKALKQVWKTKNRPLRFVPNNSLKLNTAQVQHNNLLGSHGIELDVIGTNNKIIISRTVAIQDIASYTKRDRQRPMRDPRVGMLPPKLAQIIINLAVSHKLHGRLLDPFCGTGVILQEAALMGYDVYGTDNDQRMIEYANANFKWLTEGLKVKSPAAQLEQADALNYQWSKPIDFIASETYLGKPFVTLPTAEELGAVIQTCNTLVSKFLKNTYSQLSASQRLCIAVPAWQVKPHKFRRLPLIDRLSDLGYNRISFKHLSFDDLIYYRENQIVGRELLVLERK